MGSDCYEKGYIFSLKFSDLHIAWLAQMCLQFGNLKNDIFPTFSCLCAQLDKGFGSM